MAEKKILGYLPNDAPPFGRMIVLGFQHVLAMFPATVLVALLVGFDVGTVLTVSGVATITALILSKLLAGKFIPLYYGSSFSYIAATLAITNADFGVYAADKVAIAQVGIVATGVINILVGLSSDLPAAAKASTRSCPRSSPVRLQRPSVLPWLSLPWTWLPLTGASPSLPWLVTIVFSVYLQGKGFFGLIPVLLGAVAGYLFAAIFGGG